MKPRSPLALSTSVGVCIPRVREARRCTERLFGLMGRRALPPGEALWLRPCRSIHTFGMRFPLDLIFLDRWGCVLRLARNVRPWRLAWAPRGTRSVLELTAGWLGPEAIRAGDRFRRSVRDAPPHGGQARS